jgi:hypothetical protein
MDMKKRGVYEHPVQFKLKMTLLTGILLSIAIGLESRFLIIVFGVACLAYVFYRVLTDPVKTK